jgi:hypothetical protein
VYHSADEKMTGENDDELSATREQRSVR